MEATGSRFRWLAPDSRTSDTKPLRSSYLVNVLPIRSPRQTGAGKDQLIRNRFQQVPPGSCANRLQPGLRSSGASGRWNRHYRQPKQWQKLLLRQLSADLEEAQAALCRPRYPRSLTFPLMSPLPFCQNRPGIHTLLARDGAACHRFSLLVVVGISVASVAELNIV